TLDMTISPRCMDIPGRTSEGLINSGQEQFESDHMSAKLLRTCGAVQLATLPHLRRTCHRLPHRCEGLISGRLCIKEMKGLREGFVGTLWVKRGFGHNCLPFVGRDTRGLSAQACSRWAVAKSAGRREKRKRTLGEVTVRCALLLRRTCLGSQRNTQGE